MISKAGLRVQPAHSFQTTRQPALATRNWLAGVWKAA